MKLRVLVVDPLAATITEAEIDKDNGIADYYKLLSDKANNIKVDCFTIVAGREIDLYVDDEGLFKGGANGVFKYAFYPQPLCGRAIVTGGCDDAGDTLGTTMTVEDASKLFRFAVGRNL